MLSVEAIHEAVQNPRFGPRFWSHVRKTDGCWVWTAYRDAFGYGRISLPVTAAGGPGKRPSAIAHRVSWALNGGDLRNGLHVLHRCDNPPCVRPDHLFRGTDLDNTTDMIRKGRKAPFAGFPGELQPNAKLTEAQVMEIRRRGAAGESTGEIARTYGVHRNTVIDILRGARWSHLPMLQDPAERRSEVSRRTALASWAKRRGPSAA